MPDTVIKGGRVVDGTGAPPFTTMVSGRVTREYDQATGELPGRLVRFGRC